MSRSDTARVVNIAVLSGPFLLLLRRAWEDSLPGVWEIPGGGVEPGESFQEAARRELAEETGIRSDDLREIHHQTGSAPRDFRSTMLELAVFLLRISPRPEVRVVPGEHSEYLWANPQDLRRLQMMELNRSLAELAFASQRSQLPD